jgi:hypothetical protein
MQRAPRRLPDRLDNPVPALPGLNAVAAAGSALSSTGVSSSGAFAAQPSSPSCSPSSSMSASLALAASPAQSAFGPSSALAPLSPRGGTAGKGSGAPGSQGVTPEGAPLSLVVAYPHLRRALRRTAPLADRTRVAMHARVAATRARDHTARSRNAARDSVSLARTRLDVADLVVRALEAESARVMRHATHFSSFFRASSAELAATGRAAAPLRHAVSVHNLATVRDALLALDADVVFALCAHDRAKKRLQQAFSALTQAAVPLSEIVRTCTQAEIQIHGARAGQIDQFGAPVTPVETYGRQELRKGVTFRREALDRRLCEADRTLQRLPGGQSTPVFSDSRSFRQTSAGSTDDEIRLRTAKSEHHFRHYLGNGAEVDRPWNFTVGLGDPVPDMRAESDETISFATDSTTSGPPSPCDSDSFCIEDPQSRSESPPTSPLSDDSGTCRLTYLHRLEQSYPLSLPSLPSASSASTGPISESTAQGVSTFVDEASSAHLRGLSARHGVEPASSRTILSPTFAGRHLPQEVGAAAQNSALSNSSLKEKARSSVLAPRRTFARLQLARVRTPAVVRSLWSDANQHVVAAIAHVPSLVSHAAYARHVRILAGPELIATNSVGILGSFPCRAPEESTAEFIGRLNLAVQHAIPLLSELIAREVELVREFRFDRVAVRDELRHVEDSLYAAVNAQAATKHSGSPSQRAPARSLSEIAALDRRGPTGDQSRSLHRPYLH